MASLGCCPLAPQLQRSCHARCPPAFSNPSQRGLHAPCDTAPRWRQSVMHAGSSLSCVSPAHAPSSCCRTITAPALTSTSNSSNSSSSGSSHGGRSICSGGSIRAGSGICGISRSVCSTRPAATCCAFAATSASSTSTSASQPHLFGTTTRSRLSNSLFSPASTRGMPRSAAHLAGSRLDQRQPLWSRSHNGGFGSALIRQRRTSSPIQPPAAMSVTTNGSDDDGAASRGQLAPVTRPKFIALCFAVLVFGVSNRVLYRMALVPMQDYVFFLAQFQNVVYLLVYFSALYIRFRAHLVTPAMLALPKTPMVLIGGCEAASQLLFMVGASHLPGVLLPLVNQTYLVWNLTFASLLLGMRYTRAQIFGALLVVVGVMTAVAPARLFPWSSRPEVIADMALHPHAPVEAKYVMACVACFAFPALASIIKEKLFRSARRELGGVNLDIFVVNSFASLFQALLVLLMLPISLSYNKIALTDLPSYLHQGANCFQGLAPTCGAASCDGAPLLPVLYVVTNLCFNVSILTMIRTVGSVTTTIVGSCLVPLTMLCFTLPLPYLERAHPTLNLMLGAFTLITGLLIYNLSAVRAAQEAKRAEPPPPPTVDELPQP